MSTRSLHKKLRQLESSLLSRASQKDDNLLVLSHIYFDTQGGLTQNGYANLKEQGRYIDITGSVKITVPDDCVNGFATSLSEFVADEIADMRKEERHLIRLSAMLMAMGVMTLMLCYLINSLSRAAIMNEILVVASWVFIWAAVEKFFFELTALKRQKIKLLRIYNASEALAV